MKRLRFTGIIFLSAFLLVIGFYVGRLGGGSEDFRADLMSEVVDEEAAPPAILNLQFDGGGATAFVVSADGLVLTSAHALAGDEDFRAFDVAGEEYNLRLIDSDQLEDVAILQIEEPAGPHAFLVIADGVPRVGDKLHTFSNLLGKYPSSYSEGVVSAFGRQVEVKDGYASRNFYGMMQVQMPLLVGSSGSPLLNEDGEVVALTTAVVGAEGIAFALPARDLRFLLNLFEESGEFARASLGVRFKMLSEGEAQLLAGDLKAGALVTNGDLLSEEALIPGGAAEKAGVQANDVILAVNGEVVGEKNPLNWVIRRFKIGEEVRLKIWRDGEVLEKVVRLQ